MPFCCLDLSYQEWTDFLACLPGVIPTGSSAKEFSELDHDSLSPGGCGAPSRCPWLPLPAAFSSCSCFSSSPWLLSCTCLCGGRLPASLGGHREFSRPLCFTTNTVLSQFQVKQSHYEWLFKKKISFRVFKYFYWRCRCGTQENSECSWSIQKAFVFIV